MMPYNFPDESFVFDGLETEEHLHSYSPYQQEQNYSKSAEFNSNISTTNDVWPLSTSNSNTNYSSFYFPSPTNYPNSNQYQTPSNPFHYSSSADISSTYLVDPYSQIFPMNHSIDPYAAQVTQNSTFMDSSTGPYQHLHPIYTDPNPTTLPSSSPALLFDTQHDYPATSLPSWDFGTMATSTHEITTASNSSKQPCLVCHEESSGYHFGAYTCESCKVFYRRATKDRNIEIKHSCEIPLSTITKFNRKDCRACRKAKCDQAGMTITSKDRLSRTKPPPKPSSTPINNLLEQLAHDLTYNQLSTSSALENLLHLLELPSILSKNFDYHSLYMTAIHLWRNQAKHSSPTLIDLSFHDTFAVLLFLFYLLMTTEEHQSTENVQLDKLVNILQEEIKRRTGIDHRLACRMKALFMKCYVALAQYYSNSTNYDTQSQMVFPYEQNSIYG